LSLIEGAGGKKPATWKGIAQQRDQGLAKTRMVVDDPENIRGHILIRRRHPLMMAEARDSNLTEQQ
jgi:hypothetical protein